MNTARVSDDRFYGVVVREFGAGRTTDPGAVEVLGENLKPATIEMKSSAISNLIRLQRRRASPALDIWLSPKLIDFNRKADIRINGKPYSRQAKIKLDMEPMLDDLQSARRPEAALLAPDQHAMSRDGVAGARSANARLGS